MIVRLFIALVAVLSINTCALAEDQAPIEVRVINGEDRRPSKIELKNISSKPIIG